MRIKNITDYVKNTAPKVIGIAGYNIMPGEAKIVPDAICYCTIKGKKAILPGLQALIRTRQIEIEEGIDVTDDEEEEVEEAEEKTPVETKPEAPAKEVTDEDKKAEAAKKRAEARAAAKAAKEAASA